MIIRRSFGTSAGSNNSSSNGKRASLQGMQQFFEWLEQNYGGNLPMDPNCTVLSSNKYLQTNHLQALFQHDALALHVKDYFPKRAAIELGQFISQQALQQQKNMQNKSSLLKNWKVSHPHRGLEMSDVYTFGHHVPHNVAVSTNSIEEYYKGVKEEFQFRRNRIVNKNSHDDNTTLFIDNNLPYLYPLDKFRLELDEAWANGAGIAKSNDDNQQNMGAGLPRIIMGGSATRWKQGFIHVDEMAPLSKTNGTFSANIYLKLPNQQSNDENNDNNDTTTDVLEIWPLNITSRWDWYRNAMTLSAMSSQDAEGQMLLRQRLGEPITISVEPGDLVLLCVQRPHAAIGISATNNDNLRVSLQCFLRYNGPKQRLLIDC